MKLEVHCPNPKCWKSHARQASLEHTQMMVVCPHCGEPLKVVYEVRGHVRRVTSERSGNILAPLGGPV